MLNLHEPGVALKPLPLIVPVPVTASDPLPCWVMVDDARSNVNPPTLQRPSCGPPGLKVQDVAIVTGAPTLTLVKLPDRLTTVGFPPAPLSHPVTLVAVMTEPVSS